ncbi:MAG: hypothetical protein JXB04_03005 [Kiritimatiellae bacterium]|nr:hypothetical protein [Kiritimatiellia bacterium]
MKRWIARIALGLLSVGVALVLLEFAVRALFPAFDPTCRLRFSRGTPDRPPLGPSNTTQRHVQKAGDFDMAVSFNRHGLRDRRDIAECGPDDYVVVGDSFAFGWGVAEIERFSNLLEPRLGARVFNIAMPSATVVSYRNLLRYAEDLGMQTSNLIVAVCMENDLVAYQADRRVARDRRPTSLLNWLKSRLKSRSSAFLLFVHTVRSHPRLKDWFARLGLLTIDLESLPRNRYDVAELRRAASAVEQLTHGCDATVLIIPSRRLWIGNDRAVEDRVHEAFVRLLRADGLRVVDARPALEADGDPLRYHYPRDGHWNVRGHALAAELLARELREGDGDGHFQGEPRRPRQRGRTREISP